MSTASQCVFVADPHETTAQVLRSVTSDDTAHNSSAVRNNGGLGRQLGGEELRGDEIGGVQILGTVREEVESEWPTVASGLRVRVFRPIPPHSPSHE